MNCRVGFYVGSFDPFHIGHLEVCQVVLKYVDKILIIPNNPNKSKPLRTDLHHRLEIIKLMISDETRIEVTNEEVNILNERLYKDNHLIGIIGDDVIHKEPKMKVHEYLIVPRTSQNIDINWSVPITLLPKELFKKQDHSSTEIRRNIMGNNYSTKLLNQKVIDYIIFNELYSLESFCRKKYPDKQFFKYKPLVYHVIPDQIVIKGFPNYCEFSNEKYSYEIANKLNLKVPQILFEHDGCIIGLEYVGKPISSIVLRYGNESVGVKVGKILRQLHDKHSHSVNSSLKDHRKIRNIIESNILHKEELLENYIKNPGLLGYCHGDASINNFCYYDDTVTMIDFGGLAKMENNGIPCYEYYQFLSSCKDDSDLIKGFIKGYGELPFTLEAINLFKTYWDYMNEKS